MDLPKAASTSKGYSHLEQALERQGVVAAEGTQFAVVDSAQTATELYTGNLVVRFVVGTLAWTLVKGIGMIGVRMRFGAVEVEESQAAWDALDALDGKNESHLHGHTNKVQEISHQVGLSLAEMNHCAQGSNHDEWEDHDKRGHWRAIPRNKAYCPLLQLWRELRS